MKKWTGASQGFSSNAAVTIQLDDGKPIVYTRTSSVDTVYLEKGVDGWAPASKPGNEQKGPHRYETFKEAFDNRMVFVYGSNGSKEGNEANLNKARFDAETWCFYNNKWMLDSADMVSGE